MECFYDIYAYGFIVMACTIVLLDMTDKTRPNPIGSFLFCMLWPLTFLLLITNPLWKNISRDGR